MGTSTVKTACLAYSGINPVEQREGLGVHLENAKGGIEFCGEGCGAFKDMPLHTIILFCS